MRGEPGWKVGNTSLKGKAAAKLWQLKRMGHAAGTHHFSSTGSDA